MAFQPCPNFAALQLRWTIPSGVLAQTNLHFNRVDFDQEALDALTEAVGDWAVEGLVPSFHSSIVLREVYARGIRDVVDIESTDVRNVAGESLSLPQANNVSWCVAFRTAFTGRSARGRCYLPPISLNNFETNQNILDEGAAAFYVAEFETLITVANSVGWSWQVLSRYSANAPRTEGIGFVITDVGYTDLIADSQRRRLPGRGA